MPIEMQCSQAQVHMQTNLNEQHSCRHKPKPQNLPGPPPNVHAEVENDVLDGQRKPNDERPLKYYNLFIHYFLNLASPPNAKQIISPPKMIPPNKTSNQTTIDTRKTPKNQSPRTNSPKVILPNPPKTLYFSLLAPPRPGRTQNRPLKVVYVLK